ncbi:Uma2 family endonuclease [Actinomadura parmotrematis]|uniref:Uma2 family endonuclease n=1 Tax=Actinomadura parmotrematis TaxID=2864039 RepID=A0ABS7FW57_9ACTN|nr:Uma2 family endonuclease [Actinomadura parmotrematis]MBW8484669.1 Uma2 family endonuclease [Actinomadura parmotrematis]
MRPAREYGPDRGPNTVADLDALPDEGKQYELAHGWLIQMSPSVQHDETVEDLREILAPAVPAGFSLRSPYDVRMPDGSIYKPDLAVIDTEAIRTARREDRRAVSGDDLLLAVEVQRPGSGSRNTVHITKVNDYARAGIPHYWILDLDDVPVLSVYALREGRVYERIHRATGDEVAELTEPLAVRFSPASVVTGSLDG